VDNRTFVNGVLWTLRSGAYWRHVPERYGVLYTIHTNRADAHGHGGKMMRRI
jgi:transposase